MTDPNPQNEQQAWSNVKQILGRDELTLGEHWSFNLRNDPKRLAFVLSRYKFAAKMACRDADVLELGCSEGIGTPILTETARSYTGVDMDAPAIDAANANWAQPHIRFICNDFLGRPFGEFDAVISLDVVEHIQPESEAKYFDTVITNLRDTGTAVIGTPNQTADVYASPMSKAGHVNLFDAEHLRSAMQRVFHNIFMFGINDEIVHTGFAPMAHYLVAVGCNPKK